jgi:hypothetical protein
VIQFLPVTYQVKKIISQALVLLWGEGVDAGYTFSHHCVGLGFIEKKIIIIRILVTWFNQYSCLTVQNFAIIDQL